MRYLFGSFLCAVVLLPVVAESALAVVPDDRTFEPAIRPLAAFFGVQGRRTPMDVTSRITQLCGTASQSCQIFCSETTFGGAQPPRRAVCRVTYSCGPSLVRSVEAARDEPILMRCPRPPEPVAAVSEDALVPPPISGN